jgi:hypothetical protein
MRCSDLSALGRARKEFCSVRWSRRPKAECAGRHTSQLLPGHRVTVAIHAFRGPSLPRVRDWVVRALRTSWPIRRSFLRAERLASFGLGVGRDGMAFTDTCLFGVFHICGCTSDCRRPARRAVTMSESVSRFGLPLSAFRSMVTYSLQSLRLRRHMHAQRPNHALQRLERSGESAKGILLRPMEQKAEGRVCRAAHESTAPRPSRPYRNPSVPPARSDLPGLFSFSPSRP